MAPYEGFINIGGVVYKEWQNDSIAAQLGTNPSGDLSFSPTWEIEVVYDQPLGFLPPGVPLNYNVLVTIYGPKCNGAPDAPNRITEYYIQQALVLDVGQMIAKRPNLFSVWGAYRWRTNKFGLNPTKTGLCCTTESMWTLGSTVHF
jgi:hypothetical protein